VKGDERVTVAEQDTREQAAREAVAAEIEAVAPTARVWPVWVMGLVNGENAAVLRSPADVYPAGDEHAGEQRIHAYTITRIKSASVANANESKAAGTGVPSRRPTTAVALSSSMTFRVRGVYAFRHGGDSGVHSENVFKAEIERIVLRFAGRARVGLDHSITGHDQVQSENEGFNTYGKRLCHVVDLSITVQLATTVATV
jgi:hypothetical protein